MRRIALHSRYRTGCHGSILARMIDSAPSVIRKGLQWRAAPLASEPRDGLQPPIARAGLAC